MATRKPTPLKIAAGTYRAREKTANPAEPVYLLQAPPKPTWLSMVGSEEWDRLVPLLAEKGVLAPVDLGVMAAYCQAVGALAETAEHLKSVPRFYQSGTLWKENPAAKAERLLEEHVKALAQELGLSPASRSKVSAGGGRGVGGQAPAAPPAEPPPMPRREPSAARDTRRLKIS